MNNLRVSVRKDEAGLLVTMSVITLAAIHFRRFRPPDGATWEDVAREAERMALQRWPGETQYRLPLPMGDGHAPSDL
jgi:hypothetical protein